MSRPLKRWGMLRLIWTPYRLCLFAWWLLFARKRGRGADTNYGHRSILSHAPVLADILRLAYLTALATMVYGAALSILHRGSLLDARVAVMTFVAEHQHAAIVALLGCSIATGLHCLLDHYIAD